MTPGLPHSPSQKPPSRLRKPRLVIGLNGMMPRFSATQAQGQELLKSFQCDHTEIFLGLDELDLVRLLELFLLKFYGTKFCFNVLFRPRLRYAILRGGSEDLRVIISSEHVRVFSQPPTGATLVLIVAYR